MIPLSDYDYQLPTELIAQLPAEKREESRLMVLNRETHEIIHQRFFNIIDHLQRGDLLILNDTKVIPARLFGIKDTGAKVEIFLLEKITDNRWETLAKPAKRLGLGTKITFEDGLTGFVVKILPDGKRHIEFDSLKANEDITSSGTIPLPPYIKYNEKFSNLYKDRYQTVFAKKEGAVAAPTAGLHFSQELINQIMVKGINIATVTLYVGIGTFKPIESENILDHKMHRERYELSEETVNQIFNAKRSGNKVVAVGTTVVRVLEGVKKKFGELKAGSGGIDLFIYPGFKFEIINSMVTNFHLPKSSLLLMISAFAGRSYIMDAYQNAIDSKYRFFSFGDAMLIKT
ncbi:MAG: tRNA preQ1(34) S-adenosylmethionine ribosyltransferase-isomerase QueA [Candidatus Margulisbacteria bacterium GWF2_35_9]|nr:MAG: tRNA preQ1(34) S-adenosylmethionine ribosyltransferase-isomerase QueA [Candidatus Margulisbacteria bacterium GWF2_35_9]